MFTVEYVRCEDWFDIVGGLSMLAQSVVCMHAMFVVGHTYLVHACLIGVGLMMCHALHSTLAQHSTLAWR